jgi:thiol-disulfide isomerase/thioredoxin
MVYISALDLWFAGYREVRIVKKRTSISMMVVLCVGLAALSGCSRRSPESGMGAEIGQSAPGFKLRDLNGQQISLDQFKGSVVMLDFWATWCGPCRMTMPLMESLHKEYADRLVLLTVNLQEPRDVVLDYTRAQGIRSRVLLDEDGAVGAAYGTESIPMQILIDKQGVVTHIQMGYGPRTASQLRAQIDKLL